MVEKTQRENPNLQCCSYRLVPAFGNQSISGQFIAIAVSTSVAEDNIVIPILPHNSPIMIV
jgi:hypothetical protein